MMTNKSLLLGLTLLGSTAHAVTAHADAQFPRIGASSCAVTSPTASGWGRGLLGFFNSSTTTNLGVSCTLPIQGTSATSATATVDSVRVYYLDNNGASGKAVQCTAYLEDVFGHAVSLGTRYSCTTPGGCTTNSKAMFSGSGHLEFSSPSSRADAVEVLLLCSLPPIQTGWAVSSLHSVTGAITVE